MTSIHSTSWLAAGADLAAGSDLARPSNPLMGVWGMVTTGVSVDPCLHTACLNALRPATGSGPCGRARVLPGAGSGAAIA